MMFRAAVAPGLGMKFLSSMSTRTVTLTRISAGKSAPNSPARRTMGEAPWCSAPEPSQP
jgi:hypothetical protein